jgi:glycosyltransferase involved in cell wall biosynthesis
MNILHISSHDLHGSRFNGYDMQYVISNQHNVEMAVWEKTSNNLKVHKIPPSDNHIFKFLTALIITFTARLGFDRLFGFAGYILPFKTFYKKADIVHLHLIHNYSNFSILSLPNLSRKKPLVWTLHDPWAFTGGCEHSFDCDKWKIGCNGRCPHPRATSLFKRRMPYFHWKIKKYLYANTDLTLIVASQWMKDKVSVSPLLKHLPCHLIPFGVDINMFHPGDKLAARKALGIKEGARVIAFRDPGYKVDKFKGMKWLMEALEILQLATPITLLIFQDGNEFEKLGHKYDIIKTGWIKGKEMAAALSSADLFLMPSIQESFGLMAVEAMSCGLPVIVFEGTALPSIIKAPVGGVAVPAKNSIALSTAIEHLLNNEDDRKKISMQARALVEADYSDSLYVNKHVELYQSIINNFEMNNKRA